LPPPRPGASACAAVGHAQAAKTYEVSDMNQTMSLKDVARLLGVKAYRIQYAFIHEAIPEPEQRVSGRRIFVPEDVRRLAKHFNVKLPDTESAMRPAVA
jgi:hypothetical protein